MDSFRYCGGPVLLLAGVWMAFGLLFLSLNSGAWFGIRGIGPVYYLMYAVHHGLPRPLAE